MNAPGLTSGRPANTRRRYTALCCLAMLHVGVIGGGLFGGPDTDFRDSDTWRVPLISGDLAVVMSLAVIWLALGTLSLGSRLTITLFTLPSIWLTVVLLLRAMLDVGGPVLAVLLATLVCTMYLTQGLLVTLVMVWLRRNRKWALVRRGDAATQNSSNVVRQFGLRHIMLWTLLAAAVLAVLRATIWDDGAIADLPEVNNLFEALIVYLGIGAIQAGVSVAFLICLGFRLKWRSAVLAVVSAVCLTALSAGWCGVSGAGWSDNDVWTLALITAVHCALLSVSIILLRTAGYKFTRDIDLHTEDAST